MRKIPNLTPLLFLGGVSLLSIGINNRKLNTYSVSKESNSLPRYQMINLLNQQVGSIERLCEDNGMTNFSFKHCLLPLHEKQNINSPMPINVRPWMESSNPLFRGKSIILYYSSHVNDSIGLTSFPIGNEYENNVLAFKPRLCKSLHSPSIVVNDTSKRFYM